VVTIRVIRVMYIMQTYTNLLQCTQQSLKGIFETLIARSERLVIILFIMNNNIHILHVRSKHYITDRTMKIILHILHCYR